MTEFGSGIVVCLAKFSEHLSELVLNRYVIPEEAEIKIYGSKEKAFSQRVCLWMNGASDHLYELDAKAPQSLKDLAKLTLKIGHGFTDEMWTQKHVDEIMALWKQACLDVDKQLGVQSDWGDW